MVHGNKQRFLLALGLFHTMNKIVSSSTNFLNYLQWKPPCNGAEPVSYHAGANWERKHVKVPKWIGKFASPKLILGTYCLEMVIPETIVRDRIENP